GGRYHRAQLTRPDHILTPSEFARAEVIEFLGVPERQVTTTHLAVHEQFLRPNDSVATEATLEKLGVRRPYLLYVGGYEPHKNVAGLLETFAHVRRHRPDLRLVMVGSKSRPLGLEGRARSLGLHDPDHVRFLLNLTDELVALYDGAELFLTLSWRETFGLPSLEAMTRGVPVVASRWGAS